MHCLDHKKFFYLYVQFLQECIHSCGFRSHSCGFLWIPVDSSPIPVDSGLIPADSSGFRSFLQECKGHEEVLYHCHYHQVSSIT